MHWASLWTMGGPVSMIPGVIAEALLLERAGQETPWLPIH